jgi:hypothetical protein
MYKNRQLFKYHSPAQVCLVISVFPIFHQYFKVYGRFMSGQ